MKYLTKFENYEYQLNEGFVDNLKKMASIGLLTTSMLMGNSSVAQQYKTLDPKQKTEIKDEVKANKVFRIGDIKMGMSIEELKSIRSIDMDEYRYRRLTYNDTKKKITELEKSIESTVQKIKNMQEVLNSKKSNQKEYLKYYSEVFNKFIESDEYKIKYTTTFYKIEDLKSKLDYLERQERYSKFYYINIPDVKIVLQYNFNIKIGERELNYLNNKDYRLVVVEKYYVNNTISLTDIKLMFYKNRLFLIYSDILYNSHTNNLIKPIDLDGYDVKTNDYARSTFFYDSKMRDCFYEDILDMEIYLSKEDDNIKKLNKKDLFGE